MNSCLTNLSREVQKESSLVNQCIRIGESLPFPAAAASARLSSLSPSLRPRTTHLPLFPFSSALPVFVYDGVWKGERGGRTPRRTYSPVQQKRQEEGGGTMYSIRPKKLFQCTASLFPPPQPTAPQCNLQQIRYLFALSPHSLGGRRMGGGFSVAGYMMRSYEKIFFFSFSKTRNSGKAL